MTMKLVSIFCFTVVTFSSPILFAKTKKKEAKPVGAKTFKDFKGHYFFELTISDEEPATVTECKKIGDPEIKLFGKDPCQPSDEMTKMFWDWSCSKELKSKTSLAIRVGNLKKCEKGVEEFRARF